MSKTIVAISGGKTSSWCAEWALKTYGHDVILYFNDTRWEHPDLYRFLADLASYLDHPITEDSDGRSPEELFYHNHALANNSSVPMCISSKTKRSKNYVRGQRGIRLTGRTYTKRSCRLSASDAARSLLETTANALTTDGREERTTNYP